MGKLQKLLPIKVVIFISTFWGLPSLIEKFSKQNILLVYDSSVLVRAFSDEGKVNEAVEVVRDMEQRGVVGASSVYYELACCLCSNGRWEDAMLEVNLFWVCCGRDLLSYGWCDFLLRIFVYVTSLIAVAEYF